MIYVYSGMAGVYSFMFIIFYVAIVHRNYCLRYFITFYDSTDFDELPSLVLAV